MKMGSYLWLKTRVREVVEYADTQVSNFAIEYLRGNEKGRKTFLACPYGAQVESFKQTKNGRKSCDTVSLKASGLNASLTLL